MTPGVGGEAGPRRKRKLIALIAGVYAALLVASHVVIARSALEPPGGRAFVSIPEPAEPGAIPGPEPGRLVRSAYIDFEPASTGAGAPVLLLHGSPGDASHLARLGRGLANEGWRAIALDLPGFGASEPYVASYSIRAGARAALDTMDQLGIERFHVLGWSQGGGVALHMADQAPARVASMTLLASIGVQEAEGTGSYSFEHFKYALLFALGVALPEALPHFGLLGPRSWRHSFARSFWDSDQRPLAELMGRLGTPTLVLHGRRDFLVPLRAARASHSRIGTSRLVVMEGSHFLAWPPPMGQLPSTIGHLREFLSRHDAVGAEHAPSGNTAPPASLRWSELEPFAVHDRLPWWLIGTAVALWAALAPRAAVVAVALLVAAFQLDLALGWVGVICGALAHQGRLHGVSAARGALRAVVSVSAWFLVHGAVGLALARWLQGALGPAPAFLAAGSLQYGAWWAIDRVSGRRAPARRALRGNAGAAGSREPGFGAARDGVDRTPGRPG